MAETCQSESESETEGEGERESAEGQLMAVMTAAEARVYLRGLSSPGEDSTIDTLIAVASGQLAAWMGYPVESGIASLESKTYTHYLDGPTIYRREIRVPVFPVSSVTTIHDDPDLDYDAASLVAASDYTLHGDYGLIVLNNGANHAWNTARRSIRVVYVAGYSSAPADVKHAVGMQVAHIFQNRDALGKSSVSKAGGASSPLPLELLPEVKAAAAPYRIVSHWIG